MHLLPAPGNRHRGNAQLHLHGPAQRYPDAQPDADHRHSGQDPAELAAGAVSGLLRRTQPGRRDRTMASPSLNPRVAVFMSIKLDTTLPDFTAPATIGAAVT